MGGGGVNGWQQFHVCLVCQRKAGGGTGEDTVAGGKLMGYIYRISLCRRFIWVFSVYRLLVENGRNTFSLRWG